MNMELDERSDIEDMEESPFSNADLQETQNFTDYMAPTLSASCPAKQPSHK